MPEQEGRALNLFCCDRRTPSESRVASSRDQIYRFIELEDRDGRRGGEGGTQGGAVPFLRLNTHRRSHVGGLHSFNPEGRPTCGADIPFS